MTSIDVGHGDLSWWQGFGSRHPLIRQFVMFYAISMLVTVLQYVLLTFLPGIIHRTTTWSERPAQFVHLTLGPVDTYVFDFPVTGDETGGMGYFAGGCQMVCVSGRSDLKEIDYDHDEEREAVE